MPFQLSSGPIIAAIAGEAKLNSSKFKVTFHEKSVMVSWDQLEKVIRHDSGAVTPFARNERVKVYLDISTKRFSDIYSACENLNSNVRVCMKDFDYLSSAKLSPFSPTPFCNNVHKSGFFPPVESYSLKSNLSINPAHQKREIQVLKRSRELRKPHFPGLLSSRFLPKKRY